MKRQVLIVSMMACLVGIYSHAQTIVSTTPENKNVILEEFTGIHCVYCPQGHAIAASLQSNNPGDVYLINIHVGGFSTPGAGEPDFRTQWGTAIANQSNLSGYPAATVNRHVFPGLSMNSGGTAMGRGEWTNAGNQTLQESSYLNVGVEAEIDVQTREITVHVEVYYTGNSPQSINKLNVALLQNNTPGPQVGGGAGDQYNHMHRLVDLLTGQWGEDITTTTTGSFIDKTYTYTIPADYNGIPAELGDMEIVAFVTETQQEIISGSGAFPTYTNFAHANDTELLSIGDILPACSTTLSPSITIQNKGGNTLTSLTIDYSINSGTPQSHTWTGNLSSLQEETISLPAINYTLQQNNTLDVSLAADDDTGNNTAALSFDKAVEGTGSVDMVLHTDQYGSECTWDVKDDSGTVVYSGGPYGSNQTITESFQFNAGCYTFNIYDSYGDGGGAITLIDSDQTLLYVTSGNYGLGESSNFSSNGVMGVHENQTTQFSIYPNPTKGQLNIVAEGIVKVELYDLTGKLVFSQEEINRKAEIDISHLETGVYLAKVIGGKTTQVKKLILN